MSQSLQSCIQETLSLNNYRLNPYFTSLQNQTFDRDDFIETQIQFLFAVVFFSRPMSALAGKIPTASMRLQIVKNIFEEHGEGDPKLFHQNTFITLLSRMGISKADIDNRTLWPEVRTFNTTLTGVCVMDSYLVGTATMGMIERMFSDISAWVGQGIVLNNFLKPNELIHYALHEKLDIRHSEDFFQILEEPWKKSEENRYFIRQGFMMGNYMFYQLFAGLYAARKRRDFSEFKGTFIFSED